MFHSVCCPLQGLTVHICSYSMLAIPRVHFMFFFLDPHFWMGRSESLVTWQQPVPVTWSDSDVIHLPWSEDAWPGRFLWSLSYRFSSARELNFIEICQLVNGFPDNTQSHSRTSTAAPSVVDAFATPMTAFAMVHAIKFTFFSSFSHCTAYQIVDTLHVPALKKKHN